MSAAILFSKPSRCSFEKGRLFGSAQTRSSRASAALVASTTSMIATSRLRQAGDIKHASLRRCFLQIRHRIDEAKRRGAVTGIEIARHNRAGPAADTAQHGHVLMPVRSAVADRLADDPGARLELPHRRACLIVYCFEPPLHRPVEDYVARRRDDPAPDREVLLDRPAFLRVL